MRKMFATAWPAYYCGEGLIWPPWCSPLLCRRITARAFAGECSFRTNFVANKYEKGEAMFTGEHLMNPCSLAN